MRSLIIVGVLFLAIAAAGCGRSPAGGQEGEICAADSDCSAGFICTQSVCQFLAGRDGGTRPRDGLFFVVLELDTWTGEADSGQLRQLGQFVSDLSTVLSPYYGGHARAEEQLVFGQVDRSSDPLVLSDDRTQTAMSMRRSGSTYLADQDRLFLPVYYGDDSVELAFDMPLTNANVRFDFDDVVQPGDVGAAALSGALTEDDARELSVVQGGQEFSLFDVLRGEELNADTDSDGVPDAWSMSWIGDAIAY